MLSRTGRGCPASLAGRFYWDCYRRGALGGGGDHRWPVDAHALGRRGDREPNAHSRTRCFSVACAGWAGLRATQPQPPTRKLSRAGSAPPDPEPTERRRHSHCLTIRTSGCLRLNKTDPSNRRQRHVVGTHTCSDENTTAVHTPDTEGPQTCDRQFVSRIFGGSNMAVVSVCRLKSIISRVRPGLGQFNCHRPRNGVSLFCPGPQRRS